MTDEQIEMHKQVQEARELGKRAGVEHLPPRKHWWREGRSILAVAAALIAVVCVLLLLGHNNNLTDEKNTAVGQAQAGTDFAGQVSKACTSGTAADRAKLSALGISCARASSVAAQPVAGATGARGAQGPGPSSQQISAAVQAQLYGVVATVCTTTSLCEQPINMSALVAAVRTACGGSCVGPSGAAGGTGAPGQVGASGAAGKDGATGAQGPGPTADQIADALAANCGGSCVGAKGEKGDTGATGPAGKDGPACTAGYSPTTVPQLDGGSVEYCTSAPAATPSDTPSGEPTS